MRENCLSEWNKHWDCLENHNQVRVVLWKPERLADICEGILPLPGGRASIEQVHVRETGAYSTHLQCPLVLIRYHRAYSRPFPEHPKARCRYTRS